MGLLRVKARNVLFPRQGFLRGIIIVLEGEMGSRFPRSAQDLGSQVLQDLPAATEERVKFRILAPACLSRPVIGRDAAGSLSAPKMYK